jgi:GTP pyrophosphokinase
MDSITLVTSAAVFAAEAHSTQRRKDLNEPYIVHPLRVGKMAAELGYHNEFIAACYLHDVVEDTNVPIETIEALFPNETALLVRVMTKWWQSSTLNPTAIPDKEAYYKRIIHTPHGAVLKVLDRIDNLRDYAKVAAMSNKNHKPARKYYEKTREEFEDIIKDLKLESPGAVKWFKAAMANLEAAI